MRIFVGIYILFLPAVLFGQVSEIKSKSQENSSRSGGENNSSSSSSGCGNVFFFFDMFRVVGSWQAQKLEAADSVKRLVSFEVYMQGAVQPSNYYLGLPRVRGNWGLFSTDFRFNYLAEDAQANGHFADLSTFDWQVLQLNIITFRNAIGRVGGGSMVENFGDKKSFFEWTAGLTLMSNDQMFNGSIEYRVAKDYTTNAIPRREISISAEKQIFRSGHWHGYASLGGVYQRYYQSISVWGLQAGLVIRVF
ncbi:MAG: hypothetical protein OJF59_002229 [Cytophagales bacterium]|jgi:hypothetical protein|nr:hypothetical protein [Bacteroidota bacterium]MBS1981110.1 hypothetical protein [Bacteroidota bacterium]WHZ08475.1 MAG: hypothetical protein OJF59_002229 [Cytophagales bacterium]